jgi:hypothetical protein
LKKVNQTKKKKKSDEITQAVNSSPKETKQESFEIQQEDNCFWPKDTVVNKKSLYVYLSNDELERLGIHIVDPSGNKYYYLTVDGESSSSACFNVPCRSDTMTATPFYIEAVTDTLCTTERWGSSFYSKVDTLIPVLANDFDYKNRIFWFNPSDSIFKVLPERYSHLKSSFDNLKCLKTKNPEKYYVNHWDANRNIVLDEINHLDLSKSELEAIGIQIRKNKIELSDTSRSFYYRIDKQGKSVSGNSHDTTISTINHFPVLITDIKGLELHRFGRIQNSAESKNNSSNYDLLIPVLIPLSEYIENRDYSLVFWYYPTDEFLSTLPELIKKDLKSEIEIITNPNSELKSSCTYFEVCKSTLNLEDFIIFPNPAKFSATIEFNSMDELEGSISLVNISGSQMRTLVPKTSFMSGENSYQVDLSGITPGIYLVSISTNKGFKTQRLIISQ